MSRVLFALLGLAVLFICPLPAMGAWAVIPTPLQFGSVVEYVISVGSVLLLMGSIIASVVLFVVGCFLIADPDYFF